ncbi:MAG: TetR family transcriptional regulator [Candidatus Aminicenantes bacterium]|jgi:AcrR family transcriptional regulator
MQEERKKIMEAALNEFSEFGFINSSIESIASRAELEPAVVRALFIDKKTLLKELFRSETEPMVNAIALAVQEIEDPKELIRKAMEHMDRWLWMHPKHVKLYMRCWLDGSDILETVYKCLMPSEFFQRLNELIEQGQVRCNDLFILSLLLDSLIMFFHMMKSEMHFISSDAGMEEIAKVRFEAVMDLLENGLYSA